MSKVETKRLILIFIVAVLLNYLWELAQAPLYVGLEDYNAGVLWHCFVASLGDGIMVLLIVAAGLVYVATIGLVSSPRRSWLLVNHNGGTCPGGTSRMGGSPHLESMGIYREHAEVTGA